jgi:two-component system OmpR family response regulator
VDTAAEGRDALAKVAATRPDLVVLDISMPGIDGLEVVERLRRDGVATPVVFLTARDAPADRVRGLHVGGDDYITKPFSLDELLARIEAILRRVSPSSRWQREIAVDDLTLDKEGRDVRRAGQRIEMSRTEFNVLEFLMMNVGRVVSKQQILEHVWQYDFGGESTVVETYVSYLRKKLDCLGPPMIHTMRGVGYVLRNPAED